MTAARESGGAGSASRRAGYGFATESRWFRDQQNDAPQRDYLSFLVGNEEYGLEIGRIREIIKVRDVTEVPHTPAFVIGVIAVRGSVLPVIDLRRRLRLPAETSSRTARFLIVMRDKERFGLLVNAVQQVLRLADAEIEPPPPTLSGGDADFLAGIGRSRGRMIILLNLDAVLRFEVKRQRSAGSGSRTAYGMAMEDRRP